MFHPIVARGVVYGRGRNGPDRLGANLFSDCLVALDARTGRWLACVVLAKDES